MKVLEFAKVRILPEYALEEFQKEANIVVENFLSKQKGFVSHKSYITEDGSWVDLVEWESINAAKNASNQVMKSEICAKWMKMMDPESIQMEHLTPIE